MSDLIVSISGVRGIVGDSLTPSIALEMAAAFAEIADEGDIIVASDGRTSGDSIRSACCAGLTGMGRNAIDLGIATTPTTEMAVTERGAAGAVIITASHNPVEWNGLKFLGSDGVFLRQPDLDRLTTCWRRGSVPWHTWRDVGGVSRWEDAARTHVGRILDLDVIDVDRCRAAAIPVVLDTINASGGMIAPMLLERLGCSVVQVNAEITGRFSRIAEPVPEHIAPVGDTVRDAGAAVGLVLDPDGDRLALIDETGTAVGEEYTLALATYAIRRKHPGGPVVVNASTSRMIDDVAAMLDFTVHRTAVGEINVVEGMLRNGASLGGEGNGGVIYGDLHLGRDGLLGIALIVDLLASDRTPLSELRGVLPRYTIVKEKIAVDVDARDDYLRAVASLDDEAELDTCDGVKLIWSDRWLHVRPSNTEPVVRIIAEAPTREDADALCRAARSLAAAQ